MTQDIKFYVGLDVHKDSIAIAVAETGSREPGRFVGTTGHALEELEKALLSIGSKDSQSLVYEAGPCGYDLYRSLVARGWICAVIAPSRVARRPADRIKTDRRDALLLARLHRSAELVAVQVPDSGDEAIRDLVRLREDAVRAQRVARQHLAAFLLRHGYRYTGKTAWGRTHQNWMSQLTFADPVLYTAYAEYRLAVQAAAERLERCEAVIQQTLPAWRWQPTVAALTALRGIQWLTAVKLVAELGDLRRFAHPRQLMAYLGLVPSEYSSGSNRQRGPITRTGNSLARRTMIESAWSYRFPARIGKDIEARQTGLQVEITQLAWKAQQRLCVRYRRLSQRGLHVNKVCTAIARELTGFVWAIALCTEPVTS
ncbi:MAG: IS110 family transposase [Ferrovum sp.]|nr:IS110 family transposase [Ferrovum sp.]